MIDASKVTNFQRSNIELQEFALFTIAVSGKNAAMTARNLERFLSWGRKATKLRLPFAIIKKLSKTYDLGQLMKEFGFGCWGMKSRGFLEIASSGFDLKKCTLADLESIHGIAQKTSRFFVMHSRKDQRIACLDVHVLNWMREFTGHDIPTSTPKGKRYLETENKFLDIAEAMNIGAADLDLKIWLSQRGGYKVLAA